MSKVEFSRPSDRWLRHNILPKGIIGLNHLLKLQQLQPVEDI